jgi:hypothetical protein
VGLWRMRARWREGYPMKAVGAVAGPVVGVAVAVAAVVERVV